MNGSGERRRKFGIGTTVEKLAGRVGENRMLLANLRVPYSQN
jgi:hypothetical protein